MKLSKSLSEAYNLLDLDPDAEASEIDAAYEHLCRLYGSGRADVSIQLLEGEWNEEDRSALLEQIKQAFNSIKAHLEARQENELEETLAETFLEQILQPLEFSGQELRRIREEKGIGLHEIYKKTQLPYKLFAHIEQESYAKLPEPGLLRWYVSVYAKILGLESKQAADDYMKRYRRWSMNQG